MSLAAPAAHRLDGDSASAAVPLPEPPPEPCPAAPIGAGRPMALHAIASIAAHAFPSQTPAAASDLGSPVPRR